MALIKFKSDSLIERTYLHSYLSSDSFKELISNINIGGTQKFISLGAIRKLLLNLPPLSLQEQFASKIEAIEKQKRLIKKSIKETEDLFNSRMDYYFNDF
jgi:type I restriction enzyme S subunit